MRAITIKVGKKEKDCLDPKYMDGVCKVRGLAIEGDSREKIAEAEALRRQVLNTYAALMYNFYTDHSIKALDRAFSFYRVNCLSELIQKRTEYKYIYLLTLFSAEDVLRESKRQIALGNPDLVAYED